MIFVTVGTHEQSFERLTDYMDRWAASHDEEVVMQIGYTKKEPENCTWRRMIRHSDFLELLDKSRIVITHGGPACFTEVLKAGKIPIVVPRKKKYGEHVDDHQIGICREYEKKFGNILVIEDIEKLSACIENYDTLTKNMTKSCKESNNENFCRELSDIVDRLFSEGK
ncbi:MAG: multidrug MFS transporter [Clostridiales bacterium]|nr:multidrug MFS transporter [Clostridiales bacterium]